MSIVDNKPGKIQRIYDKESDKLYNYPSPYDGQSDNDFISFGPKQPYIYKKLTSSPDNNFLSSIYSQEIDDLERVTKFLSSNHGIYFIGKQTFLQRYQPFNETRTYNPASPILAAARPMTMGLTDYPIRHFDSSNPLGLTVGVKLGNTNSVPPGSVTGTGIVNNPKGLLRAGTANLAYGNLTKAGGGDYAFGGLLGMGSQLFNSFIVQSQTGNPEFRADEKAYDIYTSNVNYNSLFRQGDVSLDNGISNPTINQKYFAPISSKRKSYSQDIGANTNQHSEIESKFDTDVLNISSSFYGQKYIDTEAVLNSLYKVLNNSSEYDGISNIKSSVDLEYHDSKENRKYYEKTSKKQLDNAVKYDSEIKNINRQSTLQGKDGLKEYKSVLNYTIPFYFHDIVNDVYIPFNATMKDIGESFIAEWAEVKFVGRADRLYNYSGYTRTINFGFVVYADSIKDLLPMWKRINYFCGLVKPSRYTTKPSSNNTLAGELMYPSSFVIPPMVKFTFGDFYKNHPLLIETINTSIPTDAQWETMSEDSNDEEWDMGNVKIALKNSSLNMNNGGIKVAQFPRYCEFQVTGKLLEKERPQAGHANWGDYLLDGATGSTSLQNSFSNKIIGVSDI